MKTGSVWSVVALLAAMLAGPTAVWAQEEAAPKPAAVPEEAAPQRAAASEETPVAKEQSIYIPYKELRKVFEKEGRGVFLPYEKFIELWQQARRRTLEPVEAGPPVEFLISEAENVATVAAGSDVVAVRSAMKIEILKKGWHQVPLRLADAAVTRAAVDKKPARLLFHPGQGYTILLKKDGDGPQTFDLALEFAKAFTKAPGQNSVSFQSPRAPVSRWEIRIPDSGVKVNIDPMIAATEMPEKADAKGTTVLAFVGAAPTVRIGWTPKAEGAMGLAALASAEAVHRVSVEEGVVRSRVEIRYAISRAELPVLQVLVPAGQKVVNVFDPNVRQWSVQAAPEGAETQTIDVQLFEPAKASQRLVVELEKYDAAAQRAAAASEVRVPVVQAVGVVRQQGTVVVDVATDLRAEATLRRGLIQVDPSDLPADLRRQKWAFSYRYAALPFALSLKVEKIQPRITVEALVEARLRPDELLVDMLAVYTIERAGVFQLAVEVPEGYEVRQVRGIKAAGAEAVQVDNYHLEAEDRRLTVDLRRKAIGRAALAVALSRRLNEPDLLSPTGKDVEVPLGVPRVFPKSVDRETGRLVVYAPETLRVRSTTEGLRSIDVSTALKPVGGGSPFASAGEVDRPVMAFAYADEKAAAVLVAERRAPQVTVRQLLVARVETGVVKYQALFRYDIRYGAVKTLRIDVPSDLAAAKKLRNVTSGVREEELSPAPEDLDEGYVAWQLTGEKEFTGRRLIRLTWETPIEKLDIGKSVDIAVPRLKPRDGRAWGQIVLTKAETIDLVPVDLPEALRPIDPQHDVAAADRIADAARAFEFHADWALTVRATRYELEETKRTSIERALVRMVVTRGRTVSVQALYRMRSARQRLQVDLPKGVEFDDQPLRINGRAVSLEKGEKEFFIPLVGQNPDAVFLLELRYTVKGVGLDAPELDIPAFPDEPATQKVYLLVYLPDERAWLGASGPWTDEQRWRCGATGFTCRPRSSDAALLGWVTSGVEVSGRADETFQTDGRRYLFSTVQPSGSLRVVSMSRNWLNGFILVGIILGGLVLTLCSASARWLAVGAFVVLMVLAGVFVPTFARQVANGVMAAAVGVVLVVWLLRYVLTTLSRRRRERPQPPPADEAPPAPGGPEPSGQAADDQGQEKEADHDA